MATKTLVTDVDIPDPQDPPADPPGHDIPPYPDPHPDPSPPAPSDPVPGPGPSPAPPPIYS